MSLYTELNKRIAKRIKILRITYDYTQKQVADALGVSQFQYSKYEGAHDCLPKRRLLKLCEFYNITESEFMNFDLKELVNKNKLEL